MNRKDLKIGLRVVPSGRGFTKYWNLSRYIGTVKEIGQRYIKVVWDGFGHCPIDDNIMPVHLSPAITQANNECNRPASAVGMQSESDKSAGG